MMPRTATSTSSDTSRLVARNAANALSKSGSVASRWRGMRCSALGGLLASSFSRGWRFVTGMLRHRCRAPHRTQVLELGLYALHAQPDGCPVREVQRHVARRRITRLIADGEQGNDGVLPRQIDP